MAESDQEFTGTVKSFNATKGWGFVESAASQQIYGADVFLLKSELTGAIGCSAGDNVSFQVTRGQKGIQARNVRVISGSGSEDQTFFGTVKGFDPHKGWGFISCDLAMQTYGKDVFVTGKQIPGGMAPEGTQVQFTVRMEEKGPVAQTVRILNQGKGFSMMGKGMGKFQGKGMGSPQYALQQWAAPQMWGKGGPAVWGGMPSFGMAGYGPMWGPSPMMWGGPAQKDPDENSTFFGAMKTINVEKGWGHIDCDSLKKLYGKDMFVMKSNLEGAQVAVGQEVQFNVAQGPKGPHAVNIRPFAGLGDAPQTFSGIVKSFNEGKGWGFIENETARQIYQQDVFVHMKEMQGVTPGPGTQVQFGVDISSGRPSAKNVLVVPS